MIRPLSMVKASAGSGKTHFLSGHLLALLCSGESPSKILASTFTRKAAGEMFQRVITRLLDAILNADGPGALQNSLNLNILLNQEAVMKTLRNLLQEQDRIRISTLDSFFVSLGQGFFTEFGLPNNWRIADTWESERIEESAIEQTIRSLGKEDMSAIMSLISGNAQASQVRKFLLRQIRDLYQEFLTAPPKYWGIIEEEIDPNNNQLEVCEALKKSSQLKIDGKPLNGHLINQINPIIDDLENSRWEMILEREFCNKVSLQGIDTYHNKQIPFEIIESVTFAVELARAEVIKSIQAQSIGYAAILSKFQFELFTRSVSEGTLSFRELAYCLSTQANSIKTQDVFYRLDSIISHLLLDEFQDTSTLQWGTLEPLASEIISKASTEHTFLAVGDVKQAIYSWRGGTAELFDELTKEYPSLGDDPLELNKTYRSYPGIVDFINTLFLDLASNPAISELAEVTSSWNRNFHRHESSKSEQCGIISVKSIEISTPDDQIETKTNPSKSEIEVEILKQLHQDLEPLYHNQKIHSIGILCRTNTQIQKIERFLRNLSIPTSGAGGEPLSHSRIIQLFISLTSLADHPDDTLAYAHIMDSALREKVIELEGDAASKSPYLLSHALRRRILKNGLSHFLRSYSHVFIRQSSDSDLRKINYALSLALGFERKGITHISDFEKILESSSLETSSSSKVKVMTFHKSKGLEFDVVFLPFTDEPFYRPQRLNVLKDQKSPLQPPHKVIKNCSSKLRRYYPELEEMYDQWIHAQVMEGLCLSYVALTRAIHSLYIYVPPQKNTASSNYSLASLLRGRFPDDSSSILYYEDKGYPDVHISNAAPTSLQNPNHEDLLSEIVDIPTFSIQRNIRKKSPSELETSPLKRIQDSLEKDNNKGSNFGSIVHSILEKIRWIEEESDVERFIKKELSQLNDSDLSEQISNYLLNALSSPEIASIFQESNFQSNVNLTKISYELDVETEIPFSLLQEGTLISGRLDRLILSKHEASFVYAHIYDFKTGKEANLKLLEKQKAAYELFVMKKYGLGKNTIETNFAFLSSGKIVSI